MKKIQNPWILLANILLALILFSECIDFMYNIHDVIIAVSQSDGIESIHTTVYSLTISVKGAVYNLSNRPLLIALFALVFNIGVYIFGYLKNKSNT